MDICISPSKKKLNHATITAVSYEIKTIATGRVCYCASKQSVAATVLPTPINTLLWYMLANNCWQRIHCISLQPNVPRHK